MCRTGSKKAYGCPLPPVPCPLSPVRSLTTPNSSLSTSLIRPPALLTLLLLLAHRRPARQTSHRPIGGFLLAAVVLGGMGTVIGVLVGATILKLLPEKLREVNDYRLLMFGLLLVVMMRFRPEGLIASKRRQLEFHEDDEELSELLQAEHLQEAK